jgi:hypothetical protein
MEVEMTEKKYCGSIAIEGKSLEMLESLMQTFRCSNHVSGIAHAIRIAYEATRIPSLNKEPGPADESSWFGEFVRPPDKLILCVADNCDQPVVPGRYHCQKHLPELLPAH